MQHMKSYSLAGSTVPEKTDTLKRPAAPVKKTENVKMPEYEFYHEKEYSPPEEEKEKTGVIDFFIVLVLCVTCFTAGSLAGYFAKTRQIMNAPPAKSQSAPQGVSRKAEKEALAPVFTEIDTENTYYGTISFTVPEENVANGYSMEYVFTTKDKDGKMEWLYNTYADGGETVSFAISDYIHSGSTNVFVTQNAYHTGDTLHTNIVDTRGCEIKVSADAADAGNSAGNNEENTQE